jgi:hypothetical protein
VGPLPQSLDLVAALAADRFVLDQCFPSSTRRSLKFATWLQDMIITPARRYLTRAIISIDSLSRIARAQIVFAKITPGTGWGPKSRKGGVLASNILSSARRGNCPVPRRFNLSCPPISPRGCPVLFICVAIHFDRVVSSRREHRGPTSRSSHVLHATSMAPFQILAPAFSTESTTVRGNRAWRARRP